MKLLEPWLLLRLLAGVVATVLFARGAAVSWRVLRYFDLRRATEGQLALERQLELSSALVRIAAVVQVGVLALTVIAADRLSRGVRGAMCAYGVFQANEWGFRSLLTTILVALVAGALAQLYAFEARVRGPDLVKPLAVATIVLAPLALIDLVMTTLFLSHLDLSVAASCCSAQLDSISSATSSYAGGPRAALAIGAPCAIVLTVVVGFLASRRPRAPFVALAGALSVATLPLAVGAAILEVAPHAFEVPQHVCPFCLLKADAWFLGYPLFGGILLAATWGAGAALCSLVSLRPAAREAFARFAPQRLRRGAFAWLTVLALGIAPIVRYVIVSGGDSLFR